MAQFNYSGTPYTATELEAMYDRFVVSGDSAMRFAYDTGDDTLTVTTALSRGASDTGVAGP